MDRPTPAAALPLPKRGQRRELDSTDVSGAENVGPVEFTATDHAFGALAGSVG